MEVDRCIVGRNLVPKVLCFMSVENGSTPLRRILVVGDTYGVPALLMRLPEDRVVGIVAASIRPSHVEHLRALASKHGIPFFVQPRRDETEGRKMFLDGLRSLAPDSLICHSYSMIIPKDVLELVDGQAFNVHFALLPKNRGPNPVQWSIIRGEEETGITVHIMTERLDDGPIVDQITVPVAHSDTWVTLHEKMKNATEILLDRVLPRLLEGSWSSRPQVEGGATSNKRIPKESFEIDFRAMTDLEIYNLIRAQAHPLEGPFIMHAGKTLRFNRLLPFDEIAELRKQYTV